MAKETYIITLERPRRATVGEMKAYIEEAVSSFGGCLRPPRSYGEDDDGDPFFGGVECTVRKS